VQRRGNARFAAILNRFAADVGERASKKAGREEGLNLKGRGHERREITRMLDMYDLHDFCYRDAPSPVSHIHADIW